MDRPVRIATVLAGLFATGLAVGAEDEDPSAKRKRAISPHVAEMLSAVTAAKFQPPASDVKTEPSVSATTPAESAARERLPPTGTVKPANGIVRLPDYIVRERKPAKLPDPIEVLTARELEKHALQTYLGDETGLDRALNMLTPVHLWRMIPVLGKFPFLGFETNEQRAVRMYREDREAKAWADAMGLLTPEERAAIARPTGSAPVKK